MGGSGDGDEGDMGAFAEREGGERSCTRCIGWDFGVGEAWG